jgi:fatty-acyl-CoA synthase
VTAVARTLGLIGEAPVMLRVMTARGVVRPYAPHKLALVSGTLLRWGTGLAGGFTSMSILHPRRPAMVDELGSLTYGELHERTNRLADGLRRRGVRSGDSVAVMCRNHRGFLEVSIAGAKLGADVVYLNTAFSGPQLADVLDREGPRLVVCDQEFADLLDTDDARDRVIAWFEGPTTSDTVESLILAGSPADHRPPPRPSRLVILTSGTTGSPKGAPRSDAGIEAATALLSRLPLRAGWRCHVAAPLFHTWGWSHLALAMLLGSTLVLRRRFDPEECLRTVAEEGCESLVVIPVMLQRILQLPPAASSRFNLKRLQVVAASGSALPGDLAGRWMDRFGDNLYNVYGSTEVAYATVADPADLRASPGTSGRVPFATVVRILDEEGRELPAGQVGRIFVGNSMLFEGYTGGGSKDRVDGLMATGDLGRFDADGRLTVEGRDDEMIVSGGENVFPAEVEDCLARHEAVAEVAAVGVEDSQFGQRLRAFVVRRTGSEVSEDDLKDHVRANLARFKVPREVVFLDELPRNATGKVLKRELVDVHRDPEEDR